MLSVGLAIIAAMTGIFIGHYLLDAGDSNAADTSAEMHPHMSEESASLMAQAKIAECLADESRRMVAVWDLDMRSSRVYALGEYETEMNNMIAAVSDSVQATEAWTAIARQAAADGVVTVEERGTIAMAES